MDWTPEQEEFLAYMSGLDRVSLLIGMDLLVSGQIPFRTARKLLSLTEDAWRNKPASGALAFLDINSASPQVKYYDDADSVQVHLLQANPNHYMVRLRPIFELAMHRVSGDVQ